MSPITWKFYVQKYAGKTIASSESLRNHITQSLEPMVHAMLILYSPFNMPSY